MAIAQAYTGNYTISTSEISLTSNTTYSSGTNINESGVYQSFVDLVNMAAGDEFEFTVYEKVSATATQRVVYKKNFTGAQSQPIQVTPSLVLMHGWDMSLLRRAGSDRNIEWSIRKLS